MFSLYVLLLALALSLPVDSCSSWGIPIDRDYDFEQINPYLSKVYLAEKVVRTTWSSGEPISCSGIRVTRKDGSKFIIFRVKGSLEVVKGDHSSSEWKSECSTYYYGEKVVIDFMRSGGEAYNILYNKCRPPW